MTFKTFNNVKCIDEIIPICLLSGLFGQRGIDGEPGDQGDEGFIGPPGPTGRRGNWITFFLVKHQKGIGNFTNSNETNILLGFPGLQGAKGLFGDQGFPGRNGLDGIDGKKGMFRVSCVFLFIKKKSF